MMENYVIKKIETSENYIISEFDTDKPFDAIRELIENSFDANANNIDITYNAIDKYLIISDNGEGFKESEIQKVMNLNMSFKNGKTNTIGSHGIGLKASIANLIDSNFTDGVKMEMFSTCNNNKCGIIWECFKDKCMNYKIVPTVKTPDFNGTSVKVDCVNIPKEQLNEIKSLIGAYYYHMIIEKNKRITFNGEVIRPIDMFYRNYINTLENQSSLIKHVFIEEELNGEKFTVEMTIIDTKQFLQYKNDVINSKNDGKTLYRNDILNEIDASTGGKSSSKEYSGVYLCFGKYLNLGGCDSFKHLGRENHSYLNGVRIEIKLPIEVKSLLLNNIKCGSRKYIYSLKQKNGKPVFGNTIKWFKENSPSKKVRKETNEDSIKAVKNTFYKNREELNEISIKMFDIIDKDNNINSDLKELIIKNMELIKSCIKM